MKFFYMKIYYMKLSLHKNFQIYGTLFDSNVQYMIVYTEGVHSHTV